ncbi:MAG: hypothetical protein V4719_12920 [Planctomycetota bacterium]
MSSQNDYFQDFVPTALQFAGTEIDELVRFQSLLAVLKKDNTPHGPVINGEYWNLTGRGRLLFSTCQRAAMWPSIASART